MPVSPSHLPVFVYGTLRPGEKNYPEYLQGKTRQEIPGCVTGRLHFVRDGGYPYLTPGAGRVRGEIAFLRAENYDEVLHDLDRLEEYDPQNEADSVYLRRPVIAELADGRHLKVWTYYWNESQIHGEPVPDGDFRSVRKRPIR